MKRCVEAGDLRQFRTRRADRLDYREIVRLVKRRERNERGEFGDDLIIEEQGSGIVGPSMDDAMPDCGNVPTVEPRRRDLHHGARRRRMIESFR